MKEWVELLIFLFETLKLTIIYYFIVGLTPSISKLRFLMIPVLVIMGIGTYIEQDFNFFGSLVLATALVFLCYKDQLRLKILTIIMSWFTISFIDLMMWLICVTMTPMGDNYSSSTTWIVDVVANISGIVPLIITGIIMKKKNMILRDKLRDIHIVKYLLVVLVIIAMCIMSACMQGMVLGEITYGTSRLVMIASIVLSFFVVALCILYINVESSRKQLMEINALNEKCIEYQKNYYFNVMKKDEELRAFKHDVKKHMTAIEILFEKKQYDEMKDYLNNIKEYIETDIIYKTENSIADYIINATIKEIKSQGPLDIQIIGKFQKNIGISNTDMCVLLANVLNNAKEAIAECSGSRKLFMEIRNYRDKNYITIKNSSPKRQYKPGVSTKADKENHGYGMKNVYKVIEKYNGHIELKWENGMFITSIEI